MMLPEKKKNLLIGIVSCVVLIIVVILIYLLSNFIKSRSEVVKLEDDLYPTKYNYYGILKDDEDVYRINGIAASDEDYLGIRTFYDVSDLRIINNHIIFFADALNELRYNKKNNEFYLQELNSFYSNSYDINLTDSSIILRTKQSISYFNFDKTINEETQISNTLKSNEFLEDKNKVYYVLDDGIHEYDITTKEERLFLNIGTDENVTFLDKCEDILYFKSNGELFLYNDHFKDTLKLSDYINEGFTFMNGTKNGFLYITEDNKIKEFDAIKKAANDYIYDFGSKIVYSKNIKDNIYFMKDEDNKNYIVDVENKNIIKTLNNDYLYIVKAD